MKRVSKIAICIVLIIAIVATFAACSDGTDGLSAYEIAVKNGYTGTEAQWLESLKQGESAYSIAVKNGFVGTEAEWLASLKGEDGTDGEDGKDADFSIEDVFNAYKAEYLKQYGTEYTGTFGDFLSSYLPDHYESISTEAMASEAVLSCVSIYTYFTEKYAYTYDMWSGGYVKATLRTPQAKRSGGAGVIYQLDDTTGSAYIITNYHVVYDALAEPAISDNIEVLLYGRETYSTKTSAGWPVYNYAIPATYIGGSMNLDIAVLYVENCDALKSTEDNPCIYHAADIGDSTQVAVGQNAVAIGNPEGNGISVTSGIVSVDSEYINVSIDDISAIRIRVMRIDTAINGGNSGGGLFDAYGKLIGIVNAKTSSSSVDNIAYAIPANVAVYTAEGVIERFEAAGKTGSYAATKFMLGVNLSTKESSTVYDAEYQRVHIVEKVMVAGLSGEDSASAGKLQEGDVLKTITLHGVTYDITRLYVTIDLMLLARSGDEITITFERDGVLQSTTIVVNDAKVIDEI